MKIKEIIKKIEDEITEIHLEVVEMEEKRNKLNKLIEEKNARSLNLLNAIDLLNGIEDE